MFKRILKAVTPFLLAMALIPPAHAQTAVHTPTLEGTYNWTGYDTFPNGHLLFQSANICSSGLVANGLNADLSPHCVAGAATTGFNWTSALASTQGSTDTTLTLDPFPTGLTAPGTLVVQGEYESFTGVSGSTLTGITRGLAAGSSASAHGTGATAYSVDLAYAPLTQLSWGGIFGGTGNQLQVLNCGQFDNNGTTGIVSQVNCYPNREWVDNFGGLHQTNPNGHNYLPGGIYIRPSVDRDELGINMPLPINDTTNVAQTNGAVGFNQPVGFAVPVQGSVRSVPVSNIPAPALSGEAGGSCSISYEVTGIDPDGIPIPGTVATVTGELPFIPGVQGLVDIQTPQVAGITTYNLYRTAISGDCGTVTTTGFLASATTNYPFFADTGQVADGSTPVAVNNSLAKLCDGGHCQISGPSSTPPVACNSSRAGWDYTNTTATSGATYKYSCYSGASSWVASGGAGSGVITSINGDTTPAQTIQGAGSASVNTSGGVTTVTVTGAVGAGGVAQGSYGSIGGFADSTGGSTTIGPTPGFYAVHSTWTLNQINALFSRFNLVKFTGWSITSNVVTLTGNNSYSIGDKILLNNFPTSTFFNGSTITVTSATASTIVAAFTHANGSASESGTGSGNNPGFYSQQGIVLIPSDLPETPATAFTNTVAQTFDWRKGYAWQQMSQYGIKCDAHSYFLTLTAGSPTVTIGSDFGTEAVGRTLAIATQVAYTLGGAQWDWEPTIVSVNTGTGTMTLSSNSPVNYTGPMVIGTNNQAALTSAFKDVGGIYPLNFPTGCLALTDTVRWPGTSLMGQQMNFSGLIGFPFKDVLQQQDALGITGWSVTSNVATFTVNSLNVGEVLVGDTYTLAAFPVSSFFNNQQVTVLSVPTATTFTASFTHANGSATEFGQALPTTSASVNGLQIKNFGVQVNNTADPRLPHTHYDPNTSASSTVPAMYRPTQEFGQPMNNPQAPGWGTGQFNGIASIAQNSAVICVPTTAVTFGGHTSTPRLPTVGSTILFPYQGGTMYSGTVSSTGGTCAQSNYTPFTLSAALPNTAAFTSTQAEWWIFNAPQTLAVAIPGSVTFPYTITLAQPFPPIPGFESNVSSHGHIIIGNNEWDYAGDNFGGTAGGLPTLTLRKGSTTVNGGSGYSVGAPVFPLNIGQPMYDNPWPVVPSPNAVTITAWSITSNVATFTAANNYIAGQVVGSLYFSNSNLGFNGMKVTVASATATQFTMALTHANASGSDQGNVLGATPYNATYYAGRTVGNAAISLPGTDGLNTTFNGTGMSIAHIDDLSLYNFSTNSLGVSNNGGSAGIFEQANYTGYGNTFHDLRISGLDFGFVQAYASINQHGVRIVGPTSTGQALDNCTIRAGYPITLISMEQSKINRCDTYTTETSDIDGQDVGAGTALFLGYSISEIDGGGITNTAQFDVKGFNSEPEFNGGNGEEIPVSVESDAVIATFDSATIFEGGYNIFGGNNQHFNGVQMSNPTFNYGNNNYFDNMFGLNTQINDSNVYTSSLNFYNWGLFSTCNSIMGQYGPLQPCGPGFVQSYNGHDVWASMLGDNVHPAENILGGMKAPGEWTGFPQVFDSTELWWGSHAECALTTGGECVDSWSNSFGQALFIGPHKRIADSKYVVKMNFKSKSGNPLTFRVLLFTSNASGSSCTPNSAMVASFFTVGGSWTPEQMAIDYSGFAGCNVVIQFDNPTTTDTLEIGYFNFVPATQQFYLPLGTPTAGNSCPVAGETQIDATHLWICRPTSGHAFGTGTWDFYGTAN